LAVGKLVVLRDGIVDFGGGITFGEGTISASRAVCTDSVAVTAKGWQGRASVGDQVTEDDLRVGGPGVFKDTTKGLLGAGAKAVDGGGRKSGRSEEASGLRGQVACVLLPALEESGLLMKVTWEYCCWRRVKSSETVTLLPSEEMLTIPKPPTAGK